MTISKGIQIRANDQTVISIYNNICKEFIQYRKLVLKDTILDNKTLSEETFKKGYIIINCEIDTNTDLTKNVFIILYHFISSDNLKAMDIKKMIQLTNGLNKSKESYDMIIITQNNVSTHITNFVKEHHAKEKNKTIDISKCLFEHDENNCNCQRNNIFLYTYSNFIITIPKHILVPEYRILNREERINVISSLITKKSKLPKIKKADPCVIWSNATTGDILEFIRNDEVTGKSIYYRLVV